MSHSLAQLYLQLGQLKKEGLGLNNRKCKKRINAITKIAGAFEPAVLELNVLAVYDKLNEPGQCLFLEGPDSYFYLDAILDFDSRGQLVEFGYKNTVSLNEVYSYIDDIKRFSDYQMNEHESLLLWLNRPSEQIRLAEHKFYFESAINSISYTNPYGLDWMCEYSSNIEETLDSIQKQIMFWDEPRTESGVKIELNHHNSYLNQEQEQYA